MKITKTIVFYCLVMSGLLAIFGCGEKANENKPVSQVKAEADKMNTEQLKSMAIKYKDAIVARGGEIEKLVASFREIPITEKFGTEAKELTAEIEALNSSVSALKQRFDLYYQKLKEKGGDLSGLEF